PPAVSLQRYPSYSSSAEKRADRSEPIAALGFVTLQRISEQTVQEFRIGDSRSFEELREHACRREPGDRVELVHEHLTRLGDEEVDACHPRAAAAKKGIDCES